MRICRRPARRPGDEVFFDAARHSRAGKPTTRAPVPNHRGFGTSTWDDPNWLRTSTTWEDKIGRPAYSRRRLARNRSWDPTAESVPHGALEKHNLRSDNETPRDRKDCELGEYYGLSVCIR